MIIEYIRYKIDSGRSAGFLAAYAAASHILDESGYCLAYELSACEEEPERFMLRIEWTSTDDHLNGFRKSPAFAGFFALVRPYFGDIEEMHHYRLTGIVKRKQEKATQSQGGSISPAET